MHRFIQTICSFFEQRAPTLYSLVVRYQTVVRYVISGGTAAVVDLGLLFIFTDVFHIWYLLSAVIAFLFAFFTSFFMQKFWTFQDSATERIHQQIALYFIVAIANLILNTALMYVFVEFIRLHYMLSQVVVALLIACGSFFVYRNFIFKKV
jgi:dolichol-phosphate mannosyltransferase